MLYSQSKTENLEYDLFENPGGEYRAIPFWAWNCRVTEELIDWQLDCFKQMGFGGVDIHPRTGLDTVYLGEEYMKLVRYTVGKCREKGLICWLYDDDRFPSGCAGGIVTRDLRMRGRYLLLTEKCSQDGDVLPGFGRSREEMEEEIRRGEKPAGYYAAAYAIGLKDGLLEDYRRIHGKEEIETARRDGKRVRFAYVKLLEEEPWFENQAYVDTMDPEAVSAFIRSTHERYWEEAGEEFGKGIPAIFTDEPRMAPRKKRCLKITAADSDEDIIIPYTEYVAERMGDAYGMDVLDCIPEYIWELPRGEKSVFRYRYQDMLSECFASSFMDQISNWCAEHGIAMTGHVLGEDSILGQAWILGDCMRCYRKMDLPGVDILADYRHFMTVKQASSVTKQNGRAGTVSELYGVTQWDCDFKTYKLQGDWQAALGITIRVPHLSWMSMEGEAKRDWPGSIFFQSPWYQEYSYIEDYFARLNTVLTRGNACTRIGVLHPVESAWLDMGPEDQTKGFIKELDQKISQIVRWLLFGTLDFDFVSEALLEEQSGGYIQRPDRELQVGDMRYSVILLPCMKTIRSSTLKILRIYAENGGEIIVIDKAPEYVDGLRSEEAAWLEREGRLVSWSEESVLRPLEKYRDVEVRKEDGNRSDNLFYQLRNDSSCDWLFLCHVNRSPEKPMTEESYRIYINGTYKVTEYDALSGKRIGMESVYENGMTVLRWRCHAQDSLLLRLEKGAGKESGESMPEKGISFNEEISIRKRSETKIILSKPDSYRCLEPNMLLLDYASCQVDDGGVYGREEILRLDNHIRRLLGFAPRDGESEQPWFLDEKENHKVVLYYTFCSEIRTAVRLGMEHPENCRIWLNGKAVEAEVMGYYVDPAVSVIGMPDLEEGENRLKIEVRYNQKTNLENLYLLGDFGVKLQENRPIVTERCRELLIGDITGQGMPFYTGNLDYDFRFQTEEEGEYAVQIPDFACPALRVFVDGEAKGLIAFAPHCVRLGQLSAGRHRLTVRLFGNRHNGFGYLHNSNEKFVWYGPAAYRTAGEEWTDRYLVRPVGILSPVSVIRYEKPDSRRRS